MNFRIILFLMSGTMFFSGCNSTQIRNEQASQREDIRELQEKIDHLQTDMIAVQSENDYLKNQVSRLKEDLAASSETNSQYQSDIARLDGLIKKLDTAREQDRKIIVDEVSSEIGRLSRKLQSASTPPPPPPASAVEEGVEHTVAKGDTLSGISRAYGVSIKKIQDANHLTTSSLKVGQKLFIPKKSSK